jgi:hypothetical protein
MTSVNDCDAADVALHLVVEVVDVLRGLDRHLVHLSEPPLEARKSVARERVSLYALSVVCGEKADDEVGLVQVYPDVAHH